MEKIIDSIEAFDRLYREKGHGVSWAQHPPSTLTQPFIDRVRGLSSMPLVYDIGPGEGGKSLFIAAQGIRIIGFDSSPSAIELAQSSAAVLGMSDRTSFRLGNIVDLTSDGMERAEGVHDYQCINHIAREFHPRIVSVIGSLLNSGGMFLTNAFNRNTTNFYDIDISQRDNSELLSSDNPSGLYCYFFTEEEIIQTYGAVFDILDLKQVPHPSVSGRVHWELLGVKKSSIN
jgi:2-polyprenyl-3-methyl-5-hydroxy-6-metoxy-1,4-benzoquinol methylase